MQAFSVIGTIHTAAYNKFEIFLKYFKIKLSETNTHYSLFIVACKPNDIERVMLSKRKS